MYASTENMEITKWDDLYLSSPVLAALGEFGFSSLTPVQASCIPLFLTKRKDVAVEAVTGSGKTLAFLIPMFEVLLKQAPFQKHDVAAIVISPTRELAAQTFDVASSFLKHIPQFSSILLIGGGPVSADISKILEDGANIIIATPGRLADLFTHNITLKLAVCVKTLEMLILDEADRLLDMGFENTLNTILSYLPKQRQTGLFSATQTEEMADLIRAGLRNPMCISVKEKSSQSLGDQKTPATLSNFYMGPMSGLPEFYFLCFFLLLDHLSLPSWEGDTIYKTLTALQNPMGLRVIPQVCEADKKFSLLISFLKSRKASKCMIFFSTCASVDYFACLMKELLKKIPVISIHGRMKKKRHEIFSSFKSYEKGILLCTDVMARGVDIPDVQWVIQFDPPSSASSFIHRCGRTARIGKTGNALVMLLRNEESFVNFLSVNQKVELKEMESPLTCDVSPKIKKMAVKNREIFEKGLRAFVSFIRFYSKHECSLLFRVKDLNLEKLANGFALLKLPRMPELKNKVVKNFKPVDINYENIPYSDKHREKQRQERLKKYKENPDLYKNIAKKKEKQFKAKKLEAKKQLAKKRRKRKAQEESPEDLEDLARDARLLKKFKKGKISKEDFDSKFAPEAREDFIDV